MSRRVSQSLDGTWKRVRVSADYSGRAAQSGFDGNIIYPVMYSVISNVVYDILRKLRVYT